MATLDSAFAADGELATVIPSFRPRAAQRTMADAVGRAIADSSVLVVEAGTGTGKTFAYLVPALLGGGKVIISTGTRNLQDQLFHRDLPRVREALGVPVSVALLKGRSNYVCPYHLQRNLDSGRFARASDAADLRQISQFARITHSGDRSECTSVREDSGAWVAATSTRDNCLGQDCPDLRDCFVMEARRRAQESDVVVVNHHLFFADLCLRDEGAGELLPNCNTVIFDEAHQLAEVASVFFGESLSSGQMVDLARDVRREGVASAPDCRELIDRARDLEQAARDLRLSFDADPARLAFDVALARDAVPAALAGLDASLVALGDLLEAQAVRGEGLEACHRRATELHDRLSGWRERHDDTTFVRWVEVFSQSLTLHATPINVSEPFRRQLLGNPRAWVFTSATLAVGNRLDHFCHELGIADFTPECLIVGSPFDYPANAMLYAPEGMPDPNAPGYLDAVVDAAWPLLCASQGRAFVLCTSLRAMREVHQRLVDRCAAHDLALTLLLQGETARSELLERFRQAPAAVLVASQSFWEGVDVPGDALSLVVIDRLPFAAPDDPVLSARIEHLRRNGRNPFAEYQLPRAVISMKQGAGRLIRTESDRGLLCVCDPRMIGKPYGKTIWRSLPPMRRTRVAQEAIEFLSGLRADEPSEGPIVAA